MHTLLQLLDYLFSGIPSNAVWDLIKLTWKKTHHREWEDLYLQAFRQALEAERPRLARYSDGNLSIDLDQLRRALHQDLQVAVPQKALSKLSEADFVEKLAAAMVERSVLEIGGHPLSLEDYQQLTWRLVEAATALFTRSVMDNQGAFQEAMIKEGQTQQKTLEEARQFLADKFQIVLVEISAMRKEQQVHTDLLQEMAGYPLACLSSSSDELDDYEAELEEKLNKEKYRVTRLRKLSGDAAAGGWQAARQAIEDCDLFIGLYTQDYGAQQLATEGESGMSWAELALDHARLHFRRCFCFLAGEELAHLHPTPPPPLEFDPEPSLSFTDKALDQQSPAYQKTPWSIHLILETMLAVLRGAPTPRKKEWTDYNQAMKNWAERVIQRDRRFRTAKASWICRCQEIERAYQEALQDYTQCTSRQVDFLEALRADFPLQTFSSLSDLGRRLDGCLQAYRVGRSTGFPIWALRQRWDRWTGFWEGELRKKLLKRPGLASPLEPYWEPFCNQSWLEQARECTEQVCKTANALSQSAEIEPLTAPLEAFPETIFHRDWREIAEDLSNWCTEKLAGEVQAALENLLEQTAQRLGPGQEQEDDDTCKAIQADLESWSIATRDLWAAIKRPNFGRCLLVLGRNGAGKTHFIANLLGAQKRQERPTGQRPEATRYLGLYLPTARRVELVETSQAAGPDERWGAGFEALLLDLARLQLAGENDGPHWRSLGELDAFLSGQTGEVKDGPYRLAILLDDLDRWVQADEAFVGRLLRFIYTHTHLTTLHWVLTIAESEYSMVSGDENDWRRLGYRPAGAPAALAGWIGLDILNEGASETFDAGQDEPAEKLPVLWRILTHQLSRKEAVEVIHLLGTPSLKLLAMPFIGWIAADLVAKKRASIYQELPNLRFIDFVDAFEAQRLEREPEPLSKLKVNGHALNVELATIMDHLTEAFLEGTSEHDFPGLVAQLQKQYGSKTWLRDESTAERLLRAISTKDLLRVADSSKERKLKLGFLPYWEYQAGKRLAENLSAEPPLDGQVVREHFNPGGVLRPYHGIFEFFLLVQDSIARKAEDESQAERAQDSLLSFCQWALEELKEPGPLRACVWTAASKAGEDFQHRLAEWLAGYKPVAMPQREEIAYYLYFLRHAWPPQAGQTHTGVPWALRLRLVRGHFAEIRQRRLHGYFARTILDRAVWSEPDGLELCLGLANLRGIEDALEPEDLIAELTSLPPDDPANPMRGRWWRVAKWAYEPLRQRARRSEASDEALMGWMLAMIETVNTLIPDEVNAGDEEAEAGPAGSRQESDAGQADEPSQETNRQKERDRLWSCLLEVFCEDMVARKGRDSFGFFKQHRWFIWTRPPDLKMPVLRIMEDHFTTALGRGYRERKNQEERRAYHRTVAWLANSTQTGRKITAVYLIYHSVPNEHPEYSIHPALWPHLKNLRDDPALAPMWQEKRGNPLPKFYDLQRTVHENRLSQSS